jgi:N-acetylmuramoyl-L-alanine amidase
MVKPQVFNLQPVKTGNTQYQHRLVLDLYPSEVADPLEALIADKLKGGTTYNAPSMTATPTPPPASKLGTHADPVGD